MEIDRRIDREIIVTLKHLSDKQAAGKQVEEINTDSLGRILESICPLLSYLRDYT